MSRFICLLIMLCLALSGAQTASFPKKQTYFGCERDYQFEIKAKAARCIKQQKLSYRPPEACGKKQGRQDQYRVVVDHKGLQDSCIPKISGTSGNQAQRAADSEVKLSCPKGSLMKIRRGKDVCYQQRIEQVKPPLKRTKR